MTGGDEARLVEALRVIFGRKSVLASIGGNKATIYLSNDRETRALVKALESVAQRQALTPDTL